MDAELERLVLDLQKVEIGRSIKNIGAYLEFMDGLVSRLPEPNLPLDVLISQDIRPHPIHTLLQETSFKLGLIKIMPTTADALLRHYLKWDKNRYGMIGLQVMDEPFDEYFRRELEEAGVQYRNHSMGSRICNGHQYNNLHEIRNGGRYLMARFGIYWPFTSSLNGSRARTNYENVSTETSVFGVFEKTLTPKSFLNPDPTISWFSSRGSLDIELNTMHPWETDLDYAKRVLTFIETRLLAMVKALEYADKFNDWILRRRPYERRAFNPAEAGL